MRPFIGITCGIFRDRDWCPPAILLRKTYTDAIVAAGGVPLIIPVVEDEHVLRALQCGAIGYITKDSSADGLLNAIRRAAQDELYIPAG